MELHVQELRLAFKPSLDLCLFERSLSCRTGNTPEKCHMKITSVTAGSLQSKPEIPDCLAWSASGSCVELPPNAYSR